jgi:hypothetical protein
LDHLDYQNRWASYNHSKLSISSEHGPTQSIIGNSHQRQVSHFSITKRFLESEQLGVVSIHLVGGRMVSSKILEPLHPINSVNEKLTDIVSIGAVGRRQDKGTDEPCATCQI